MTAAKRNQVQVYRYPIIEGQAPSDMQDFCRFLDRLIKHQHVDGTNNAEPGNNSNILVHCRGGIGRAGLLACCYLLKLGHCHTAKEAIEMVRQRRSRRAIETVEQEEFIRDFADRISCK